MLCFLYHHSRSSENRLAVRSQPCRYTLSILPAGAISADTPECVEPDVSARTAGLTMTRSFGFLCVVPLLVALTACETSKSSNPLTATVAGPLPGVEISAPKLLEPNGARIEVDRQPVTLLLENA